MRFQSDFYRCVSVQTLIWDFKVSLADGTAPVAAQ